MNLRLKGLLSIHLSVLLFGASGLFARLLDLSHWGIVWGRTFFAGLFLAALLFFRSEGFKIRQGSDCIGFFLMGVILAVHWAAFFYAIQISTVAIGLLTFSSFPIFVIILEPFCFGESFHLHDFFLALMVCIGIFLIIPEFDFSNTRTTGVFWGVISGATFAALSLFNRKYVARYSALLIGCYQNGVAAIILLPVAGKTILSVTWQETGWLMLLGVVFTALAHTLFIGGLRVIETRLAAIIASLEPVYGILFAILLFYEIPTFREITGGLVIVGTIFMATRKISNGFFEK